MKSIQEELPCPICGEQNYSWGAVTGQSLAFEGQYANFLDRIISAGRITARLCSSCGNVQLFSIGSVGKQD